MGWSDQRANLFPNYLKGPALTWFESRFGAQNNESVEQLLNPPERSLHEIFAAFNERFRSRHARLEYENQYIIFEPKPAETLIEMFWRFRAISGLVSSTTLVIDRIHHLSKRLFKLNPNIAKQISLCQSFEQVETTIQRHSAIGFKLENVDSVPPQPVLRDQEGIG